MTSSFEPPVRGRGSSAWMAVLAAIICALPATAQATAGEHELWAGLGTDDSLNVAVEGRYLYDFDDFLAFGAAVEQRQGLSFDQGITGLLATTQVVIDALTWVPALTLAAGAEARWPEADLHVVGRLEASMAYRPTRTWAVALRVGTQRGLDADHGSRFMVSVGFAWIRGGAASLDF